MTGCYDQALLWLLDVFCVLAGCVLCMHVCVDGRSACGVHHTMAW